jgi:excisionase family DNA binding protein
MRMTKVLTVDEVAEVLKVNKKIIYEQIQQRNIKALKIGRSLRISEIELERFIENGGSAS